MTYTDTRLERALLAVGIALGTMALITIPKGEPLLAGDTIAIGTGIGVAIYASRGDDCGSCGCCGS